jgi:hypothetical protein
MNGYLLTQDHSNITDIKTLEIWVISWNQIERLLGHLIKVKSLKVSLPTCVLCTHYKTLKADVFE